MRTHLSAIYRRLAMLALWSICLAGFGTPAVAQYAEELLHPYGFAMTLPPGWQARWMDEEQVQLVPPDNGEGETILVTAGPAGELHGVTDRRLIRQTEREVVAMYPMLSRAREPEILQTDAGPGLVMVFEGKPLGGRRVQLTSGLLVAGDVAVSLMAVGLRRDLERRRPDLLQILASTRFDSAGAHAHGGFAGGGHGHYPDDSGYGYYAGDGDQGHYADDSSYGYYAEQRQLPNVAAPAAGELHDGSPAAREWVQLLRGRKLVSGSGYTSGGSSGGYSQSLELTLHADGRFDYYSASSVSVYVEGMSGGSASSESASGRWRVLSSGGAVVLEYITDEGRYQDEIRRVGNEIHLAGMHVLLTNP
jgi:hypothetical protein